MTNGEGPKRVLTSTVLAQGLETKLVPVRTNKPIPKDKLLDAAQVIRQVRLKHPVKVGEVIISNLLGLGAKVIATREVK